MHGVVDTIDPPTTKSYINQNSMILIQRSQSYFIGNPRGFSKNIHSLVRQDPIVIVKNQDRFRAAEEKECACVCMFV